LNIVNDMWQSSDVLFRKRPGFYAGGSLGGATETQPLKLEQIVPYAIWLYQSFFLIRSLRLSSNSTERNHVRVNACLGLKQAKLTTAALARKSERVNSGKGASVKGGPGEVLKLTLIRAVVKYM